jgi:chromate reductase, NAD(P)H dehydrogenase (quinone)
MICIISGTNSHNSSTETIAKIYENKLKSLGAEVCFFSLKEMNGYVVHEKAYERGDAVIDRISEKYFTADKFIFVIPEYNGSYPGMLKFLFDSMDVKTFIYGKKAGCVGVASGRAGNLRGIDQLTGVLQHMQVTVMPHILPLSSVRNELNEAGELHNPKTQQALHFHAEKLIAF